MISDKLTTGLSLRIEQELGVELIDPRLQPVAGGDTHQTYRLKTRDRSFFIKVNAALNKHILESEYHSLVLLSDTEVANLYPHPYFNFELAKSTVLVMSCLSIAPIDRSNACRCAEGLVRHHKVTAENYGWPSDNYIGSTLQVNAVSENWLTFFRDQRLLPQLNLASQNGLSSRMLRAIEAILDRLDDFLPVNPVPSLLHGDLWSGNIAYCKTRKGLSVFDPAPYYGDSEVDIAMTNLFGSLDDNFYLSYRESFPKPAKELELHAIYNLYHALNHFNLFGSNYSALISRNLDLVN